MRNGGMWRCMYGIGGKTGKNDGCLGWHLFGEVELRWFSHCGGGGESMAFRCRLLSFKSLLLMALMVSVGIYVYLIEYKVVNKGAEKEGGRGDASVILAAKNRQDTLDEDVDWSAAIHVMIIFTKAAEDVGLKRKLLQCVGSMLDYVSVPIVLHLIGDLESQEIAKQILETEKERTTADVKVQFHDVDTISEKLSDVVSSMRPYFSYKPGSYYSDSLFFLSLAIHRVFPQDKVIMLDVDLKFRDDIFHLHQHFDRFNRSVVIGIAREQQPVYRHVFHMYRKDHPHTSVGEPPPDGLTGFNSAVLLLNLERMRNSKQYNVLLNASLIDGFVEKYAFKGHLGDQDFFTLVSLDHANLFYVLPCTWNKQLCQWWKHHGYEEVFDKYFKCEGDVQIYHGNCNTKIPSEEDAVDD